MAQNRAEMQQLVLQVDSVYTAASNSLLAITAVVQHPADGVWEGTLRMEAPNGIQFVGQQTIPFRVMGQGKKYLPLRVSIQAQVAAGNWPITLLVQDSSGVICAQTQTRLIIEPKRLLGLQVQTNQIWVEQTTDSLRIAVLLHNLGNTRETARLGATFPDGKGGDWTEEREVTLHGFTDTVLHFNQPMLPSWKQLERFVVPIIAFNAEGEHIGTVTVQVQNVSGKRTYMADGRPEMGYWLNRNQLSVSSRNSFSENQAWQANGSGLFQLPAGSLGFNLDALYATSYQSLPLLTNTWLNYELEHKGITVGNINENLEMFMNGRGVKLYAKGKDDDRNETAVALIDKSYNLLGLNKSEWDEGYTAYVHQVHHWQQDNRLYDGSFFFDSSPYEHTSSLLWANHYTWERNNNWHYGISAGGGASWLTAPLDEHGVKPSWALGGELSGPIGPFSLNSNNYYSSAFYPGTRRGILQLDERLSRSWEKTTVWMAYRLYRYQPAYLMTASFLQNQLKTIDWTWGVSFPLRKRLTLNVELERQQQFGIYEGFGKDGNDYWLNAFRLKEWLGWYSRNTKHQVYFMAEHGWAVDPLNGEKKLQLRVNASWSFRYLGMTAFLQQGDFTLMEALYNQLAQRATYRLSLAPYVQGYFFKKKLWAQLNGMFNTDHTTGQNWTFSANGRYALGNTTTVFGNVYLYTIHNRYAQMSASTLRLGISQKLPGNTHVSSERKGNVQVFCFYDYNGDGVFDNDDKPAEGRMVYLNNKLFMVPKNGEISYRGVPYGSYSLQVPSTEWYTPQDGFVVNGKRIAIALPLQYVGRLRGRLFYDYHAQLSMPVNASYAGLRLWIKGNNNFVKEVLVNNEGLFDVPLPVGTYTVSIDQEHLPQYVYVEQASCAVEVKRDQTVEITPVALKVKAKKINIKRFGD